MSLSKFCLILLLTAPAVFARQDSPLAAPSPSPSPTPVPKVGAFELPVPEGMPVTGIKVPHYDEEGNLLMVFEASSAKRSGENTIDIEGLKLEAVDEDGKKVLVEMPRSVFNLDTKVITGDNTASIRREDLSVSADQLHFDTNTRNGKLLGNIKMVVSTDQAFK